MRLRGLHDIKTHGSLALEGRLVSVARNLHRLGSGESEGGTISDNWSVERHIYPPSQTWSKKKPAGPRPTPAASLHRELFLENKARLHQIEVIRDFLQEARQAIAEGIPVARQEFERLTKRLAELEPGCG